MRQPSRSRSGGWLRSASVAGTVLAAIVGGLLVTGDLSGPTAKPTFAPKRARTRPPSEVETPSVAEVALLLDTTPQAIAPTDAMAINAARPLDRTRVVPARAFLLPTVAGFQPANAAALGCLTQAIYYEAGSESDRGQRAVAQVVLNRLRSPIFPHTVCGVVFQGSQLPTGCQFSFTCDGSLRRQPSPTGWLRARRIASAALAGWVERSVGLATHYHADYVVPYWAGSLDKVNTIGAHIFYMMRGGLGRPAGFAAPYDGLAEATPAPVQDLATLEDVIVTTDPAVPAIGAAPEPPANRTQVREDALGSAAIVPVPAAPVGGTLRADDSRGKLVVDENKAVMR